MKKLVQMTLVGMMFVSMSLNAQQDTKSFVQQYKKQDGFTVITLGKPAITMVSLFARGKSREAAQALKNVDALQILDFEAGCKARAETFNSEALSFINNSRFDEFIEVVDSDDTVKIFCKTEGETITGLVILVRSNLDASEQMVCIKGKFDLDDLLSLNGQFAKK